MRSTRGPQIVSAVVVGLAIASAPPVRAQDAGKGAALLAEARKAIGGADKLAAIKRLQTSGTFLRSTGPDQIIDGDFDVLIEFPDKYRKNEVTGFAGATVDRVEALERQARDQAGKIEEQIGRASCRERVSIRV